MSMRAINLQHKLFLYADDTTTNGMRLIRNLQDYSFAHIKHFGSLRLHASQQTTKVFLYALKR